MKIESVLNVTIEDNFEIQDSRNRKEGTKILIEAAHAGVVNANGLFYTPKSLKTGAESLKEFFKPLQKKHYSHTLGYIYDSAYEPYGSESEHHQKRIESAKTPEELIERVNFYLDSNAYRGTRGFGVLKAKAKLFDKGKITELKKRDRGTVSVAGGSSEAFCNICAQYIKECEHKIGGRYSYRGKTRTCIAVIADNLSLDHISFERIPANSSTRSLIIEDSGVVGKIEVITEEKEGTLMKLTVADLKEKIEEVLSSIFEKEELQGLKSKYDEALSEAKASSYLVPSDKLFPTNTPLAVFVSKELLSYLEDSEDKNLLEETLKTSYDKIFEGKTEEEVKSLLSGEVEKEVKEELPVQDNKEEKPEGGEKPTSREDKGDIEDIIFKVQDSLNAVIESKTEEMLSKLTEILTQDLTSKANKILADQVEAYKADLQASSSYSSQLGEELKESLLNQILFLKSVDKDSEYFKSLKSRTIQELKNTIEDHFFYIESGKTKENQEVTAVTEDLKSLNKEDEKPEELAVKDSLNPSQVDEALEGMSEPEEGQALEIEDSDIKVTEILKTITSKISNKSFAELYKKTYFDHGAVTAKKLATALREQNRIKY